MTDSEQPHLPRLLVWLLATVVFTTFFSRAISQTLLGATLALALWYWPRFWPALKRPPLKRWLVITGLFVTWLAISAFGGFDPSHSFHAMRREWLFLLVPLVAVIAVRDNDRRILFSAIAAGLLLFSMYGISQYLTGWDWLNWEGNWFKPSPISFVSGNYYRPLTYAVVFSSAAVLMLCLGCDTGITVSRRRLYLGAALAAFAAVLLTQRRGPMVALFVVLAVLAVVGPGRIRPVAILLLVLGVIATLLLPGGLYRFTDELRAEWVGTYQNTRLYIWTKAAALIRQSPLFGSGYGNFGTAYENLLRTTYPEFPYWFIHGQAHNDFLHWAAMTGLPGLGLFAALWGTVVAATIRLWTNLRTPEAAAIAVGLLQFLMCSLSDASLYEEESRMLGMILWGLVMGMSLDWARMPTKVAA